MKTLMTMLIMVACMIGMAGDEVLEKDRTLTKLAKEMEWDKNLVKVTQAEALGTYWGKQLSKEHYDASVTDRVFIEDGIMIFKDVTKDVDKFNITELNEKFTDYIKTHDVMKGSVNTVLLLHSRTQTMIVYAMKHPDIKEAGGREYALKLLQTFRKALLANIDIKYK